MKQPRIPFFFTSSATTDLHVEAVYLAETAGEAAALRFLHAAEQTVDLVADFPLLGTLCSSLNRPASSLRWKPLSGRFSRWHVFYRIHPDRIEVVRILHGVRDLPSLLR